RRRAMGRWSQDQPVRCDATVRVAGLAAWSTVFLRASGDMARSGWPSHGDAPRQLSCGRKGRRGFRCAEEGRTERRTPAKSEAGQAVAPRGNRRNRGSLPSLVAEVRKSSWLGLFTDGSKVVVRTGEPIRTFHEMS